MTPLCEISYNFQRNGQLDSYYKYKERSLLKVFEYDRKCLGEVDNHGPHCWLL